MKSIVRNMRDMGSASERSRPSSIDTITSVDGDGRYAHVETFDSSELRDCRIMTPYGIASAPLDRMRVQVIIGEKASSIVGVNDIDRPSVPPGGLILYNMHGDTISMIGDGINIHTDKQVSVNGKRVVLAGDTIEVIIDGVTHNAIIK